MKMTKGRVLRFLGGFLLAFGLLGFLSPSSDARHDTVLVAVGAFFSILGLGQP